MDIEYHRRQSRALGREVELKIYGHAGKPLVVFPSARGTFYQFEDFGMVEAVRPFIEAGQVRLYALSSNDHETWLADDWISLPDRGRNYERYVRHIVKEAVPFIHEHSACEGPLAVTGCSMGAYHAANFFFRFPQLFDTVIALSGLYDATFFVGDYHDENVYFNFPLHYLPRLTDSWYLERYRAGQIVICVGQGAWEHDHIRETRAMEEVLRQLEVPAWVDYWGYDVNHDWPWWRRQLPYFLGKLELGDRG